MSNELCKGYLTNRADKTDLLETLYAVLPDGRVFKSNERKYSRYFNTKATCWTKIEALPDMAEFIGNYEVPAF